MDSNILNVADSVSRSRFGLSDEFTTSTVSVTSKSVKLSYGNGIIGISISYPREIIDEYALSATLNVAQTKQEDSQGDESASEDDETGDSPQTADKPHKAHKMIKRGKKVSK